MIKVYDDFFSEDTRKEIWDLLLRPKWIPDGGDSNNWFWHMNNLESEEYFSKYLYEIICDKLNINYKVGRIYANGQSAGQCGNPHTDDGDFTFLYYPNPQWELGWQGHLIFSEDGNEPTRIVGYKSNRAVMFPSQIIHYADAPHRYYTGFRVSLAYKFDVSTSRTINYSNTF